MAKQKTSSQSKSNKKPGTPKRASKGRPELFKTSDFFIVGIGASAGGLDAFKHLFEAMPNNSGMAFVIVQHLDPSHKSMLSELLGHFTQMKVYEVKDNTLVEPNTIYTIPPNKEMGILNGVLKLMAPASPRGSRRTIDFFMRSLAEDQNEKAIGIILSGTGSEGTDGLRAIKASGGFAVVQDPETAKYDGMPTNAINSNVADIVLPVEEIPAHIVKYVKQRSILPLAISMKKIPQQSLMDKIFILLRDRTRVNFSHYKLNTVKRRIEKRMAINQIEKLEVFLKFLQKNPEQIDLLFKELLISVTAFFRDKEALEALDAQAIRQIVNNKTSTDSIRIWVTGCSTGEEAFTLAMLFDEELRRQKKKITVQIFATDIDEDAINFARLGVYPKSIADSVGPERLKRYFNIENHFCKVKKDLRDKVIFAVQNLIGDPPFSNLDMISCRNLMIYLNTDAQKRIFPVFHYSLKPQGILFLGTSETIGKFNNLFSPIDRKYKIFTRKAGIVKHRPSLDFRVGVLDTSISEKTKSRIEQKTPGVKLANLTEKILLINYAPGCAVINSKNVALYFHANTGKYLQPPSGEANLNILEMARRGLKADLRAAINKARKEKREEIRTGIKVKTNGVYQTITLKVKPIIQAEFDEQLLMVIFEDVADEQKILANTTQLSEDDNVHIIELEHELASTKEYLSTSIEELEISNEELKSANEELQSANEELQSTNEELETSKEELQSINEEMITVNTELQNKMHELANAHDDMSNLLASTKIGIVFLGNELQIRRFTPSIGKVFNLIQSDIGRSLKDMNTNLVGNNIWMDSQEVLDSLITKKRVVQSKNGAWFHMQITPYRTTENRIDGVVITFVDISDEKRMEKELEKVNEHLSLSIDALIAVPFTCNAKNPKNLEYIFIGENAKNILGFVPDDFVNEPGFWIKRVHRAERNKVLEYMSKAQESGLSTFDFQWKCANGKFINLRSHINLVTATQIEEEDLLVGIWQVIN